MVLPREELLPPTAAIPAVLLPSQGASLQGLMDSGRSPSQRSPARHRTCRLSVPSPQVTEHCWTQRAQIRASSCVTALGRNSHVPAMHTAAHLGPWPSFPGRGARCPVAGPPALGAILAAELGMDGAVGAVWKGLDAAHCAQLVARIPTRFGAVFPLICCPAGKGNGVRHCQLLTFSSCCGCLIPGASSSSGNTPFPWQGAG